MLLKFDPLLSRAAVVDTKNRGLDDFLKDLALRLPVKEELQESFEEINKALLEKHEMNESAVTTMKDLSTNEEDKTQESINKSDENIKL